MKNEVITIPSQKLVIAMLHGSGLHRNAVEKGYENKHGLDERGLDSETINRNGAAAEYAASVFFGQPWILGGKFKGPDIGSNIQIRSTSIPCGGLIIRPERTNSRADNLDDVYVLVLTHEMPKFTFVGWIRGHEAVSGREKATWGVWKNNPAWLIAQDELHPFPIT